MSEKVSLSLEFKVKETSQGYLAKGIDLEGIIIESKTEDELNKDLHSAVTCYFKSFPHELEKFKLKTLRSKSKTKEDESRIKRLGDELRKYQSDTDDL